MSSSSGAGPKGTYRRKGHFPPIPAGRQEVGGHDRMGGYFEVVASHHDGQPRWAYSWQDLAIRPSGTQPRAQLGLQGRSPTSQRVLSELDQLPLLGTMPCLLLSRSSS